MTDDMTENEKRDFNRRAFMGAVAAVGAGAVLADHLHAGMGGQSVRERLGVAAVQKVQRSTGLAVDQ